MGCDDCTCGDNVVNVKDFGAKGDYYTDDTAAVLQAFNACPLPDDAA